MIHVDVSARLHDEARVVSANFDMELTAADSADKLIAAMVAGMEETNRWADKNDVFIGHVKGFVTWDEDKAVMISTVGAAVEVKGSEERPLTPCTVKVGTANIVFGIDLHEVEERVMAFVSEVLAQFGETAHFHCEHEEDCQCGCHDHHHHHDEYCECGCHDHEHEHHHHHDEHCECGCHDHEHEHHHHHDEHCECGCHDHEHEHHHHDEHCECGCHDHEHEHHHHDEHCECGCHDHEHEHHHHHDEHCECGCHDHEHEHHHH